MDQDITLHNELSDRGPSEVTVPFSRFDTLSSLKKCARDEFEHEVGKTQVAAKAVCTNTFSP